MNLHTRSNTTMHSTDTPVPLVTRGDGNSYHSPQALEAKSQIQTESKYRAMSQVNKSSAMLRNLKMGLKYTNHQYTSLSEIDKIFALMSKEGCFCNEKSFLGSTAQDIIFTDTLRHLTNKRFSHIPLFGIGDESPVRIHLNFPRGREVYSIQPVPLLGAPGFSSFMKSGLNCKKPDSRFLDSILKEILSFMIKTSNNAKDIAALIDEVTIISSRLGKLNGATSDLVAKPRQTLITRLIQCISFS